MTKNVYESNHKPSRVPLRERGQMLAMTGLMMMGLFAIAAFIIDSARIYYSFNMLQMSTDASALAGAQGLPSSTTASAQAISYSGVSGNANAYSNLPGVVMAASYPKAECLTTLINEGIACSTTGSPATYNAIQVQQTVKLPLTFGAMLGTPSVTLVSTATAAARGAISVPYNIALIIDTTASMGGSNSDNCTDPITKVTYTTSIACALDGAKTLMLNTAPCPATETPCSTGISNAVDMISIFTFPNGTQSTMDNDYTGSCTGPTIQPYSFPLATATSYAPTTSSPSYQVTSFLNDFRTSDSSGSLNTGSNLVAAIGQKSGCKGLQTPGGEETFYAGALWAAQAAVLANQALSGRAGSQNAIILLSDGEANSPDLATKDAGGNAISKTAYTYPSLINECQQAIDAASKITATGTTIYAVAYGSSTTSGKGSSDCSTDTSGPNAYISACSTMAKIASTPATFFSDVPKGSSSTCSSAQQPASGLSAIFGAITEDFTVARLIPNSTT
jgi:hypothetical protein